MEIPRVIELNRAVIGQEDKVVFQSLDFEMVQAEVCYIIGKSGSGKSTLLKTLFGVLPLQGGKATIAGFDLAQLDQNTIPLLRRKIGMVFQEFHLFDRWSVAQNLNYTLKAIEWKDEQKRQNRVDEVLDQIKLMDKKNTPIHQLSGGEQQKVVIARAILNKPEIIIADEPTGNLDPQSSEDIMELLYNVATENKTAILIATHDYPLIEKFPARTFKCDAGSLTEV